MSTVAKIPHEIQAAPAYDVQKIRKDFPILHQTVHGRPLVYLDNAGYTRFQSVRRKLTKKSAWPRKSS